MYITSYNDTCTYNVHVYETDEMRLTMVAVHYFSLITIRFILFLKIHGFEQSALIRNDGMLILSPVGFITNRSTEIPGGKYYEYVSSGLYY